MSEPSRKSSVGIWCGILLVAVLAYPISFGPACWWFPDERIMPVCAMGDGPPITFSFARHIYWPIGWLAEHGPRPIGDAIVWFAMLRRTDDINFPTRADGKGDYSATWHKYLAIEEARMRAEPEAKTSVAKK